MIEIDLLPSDFRGKKKIFFEQAFKTRLFIIMGTLLLLHLLVYIVTVVSAGRLNILERNWKNLSAQKAQLDQYQLELIKIKKKIPLIEQLISKRVLWAKKLDRISDLLINGVWLNEISFEKQKVKMQAAPAKYLIIRGSAASRTKDEPALIGRFMQNLKDDPSFSTDFAEIELGPIKKRQIVQTEIMDFILVCRFK